MTSNRNHSLLWLRVILLSLLWATMGSASTLAERSDFGQCVIAAKGLGGNPFKGKAPQEIADMLTKEGYVPKGPDPVAGQGTFLNPKTGRSYHIDANHPPPKPPHVGVQRPRDHRDLPPREYPLQ